MLTVDTEGGAMNAVRRLQLRQLDELLEELEGLNLGDIKMLPDPLADRLRRAGVGHRLGAPVSEVIDLVFRAQEAFLLPLSSPGRSAA